MEVQKKIAAGGTRAEERLQRRRRWRVALVLADARDLAEVVVTGHHIARECASVAEYGERWLGMSGAEARRLAAIGRVLDAFPEVEALLREGRTTPEAVAALQEIAARPELRRPDDRWLEWAQTMGARTLRRRVMKRVREVDGGAPVREVPIFATDEAIDDLLRAQALMTRRFGRWMSWSEVVAEAVRDWLRRHDVARKKSGRRRMGPTGNRGSRGVPAAVERELLRRAGEKCVVEFCENRVVEMAHVRGYADGGGQEEDDLFPACPTHHRMYDDGRLTLRRIDGRVVLFGPDGKSLNERHSADPP